MRVSLFLLFTTAQLAVATPLLKRWDDTAEMHAWVDVPRGWEYHSPAPQDYNFNLRIALKQDKIDALIANLIETSDPSHPRYGQHLTPSQAESLVAAHPDSLSAVHSWLDYHGVPQEAILRQTGGGDWLTLRVSVAQAERMLGTKYAVYTHTKTSHKLVRTLSYSLPRELHFHIGVVSPTTYFGTVRSMRVTHFLQPETKLSQAAINQEQGAAAFVNGTVPLSCNTAVTPACLRGLYHTANYQVVGGNNNTIGVTGFLDEYANQADLQTFFTKYRTDAAGSNYTTVTVNGGQNDQSKPGVEANLDIQYTTGIAYPIPNIYYSTAGTPPWTPSGAASTNGNEPYLEWLNYVLSQPNVPQVLTTSYGDEEQSVPQDYANTVCNLFAQLGAVGTSVFFSSGDSGVGGGQCHSNNGTNAVAFQPMFPASCPFVTTVGGTRGTSPEMAASFSGGGFSRYFPRPSYQDTAVSSYLTTLGTTYAGMFASTGRAYPDISAQSSSFQVVVGGVVKPVAGTSASSPVAAGIFALLNDHRMSQGKPSLGFLNPLLYSNASTGFKDIVYGSNPGCGTNGFKTGPGWDPVTGLGSPDFVMLQAFV